MLGYSCQSFRVRIRPVALAVDCLELGVGTGLEFRPRIHPLGGLAVDLRSRVELKYDIL